MLKINYSNVKKYLKLCMAKQNTWQNEGTFLLENDVNCHSMENCQNSNVSKNTEIFFFIIEFEYKQGLKIEVFSLQRSLKICYITLFRQLIEL